MNSKIMMPELVDLLALKARCTKKDAELFLKEFFGLASEVISGGESLKINGLGIFKTIWVEKRASVNIQTGLPFEIPGHYKLTFTPDKTLKDAVNAPFSCFEAEILPDDVMPDAPLTSEGDEGDDVSDSDVEEISDTDAGEMAAKDVSDESVVEPIPELFTEMPEHEVEPEISKDPVGENKSGTTVPHEENSFVPAFREIYSEQLDIESELKRRSRTGYISGFLSASLLISLFVLGWIYFDKAEDYQQLSLTVQPVTFTIKKYKTDVNENKDSLSFVETVVTDSITATAVIQRKPEAEASIVKKAETETLKMDSVVRAKKEPEKIIKTPVTETVKPGVFLTTISLKHYGHKTFWVYLYEENKKKIQNPNNIPIGTTLIIPDPEKYGIDATNKESVEKAKALAAEILEKYE